MVGRLQAFAAPPVGARDGILVLIQMSGGNDGLEHALPRRPTAATTTCAAGSRSAPQSALSIGSGLGLHPSLTAHEGPVRPRQGRDRARCRLPATRPLALHVDGLLDAGLGRRAAVAGDGLGGPHHRRAPRRRQRGAVRRHDRLVGAAAPRRCACRVRAASRSTSAARSASTAPTANDRRMYDALATFGSGSTGLGDLRRPRRHDRIAAHDADAEDPTGVPGRAADGRSREAADVVRAPDQRQPRHPRAEHRVRQLRHAHRPGRLPRGSARRPRRRHQRVLRDARTLRGPTASS